MSKACVIALLLFASATLPSEAAEHSNRLISSDSPYLLAHAHNPVDWYPWGEEAFARARRENKPIFLSIGYSTCYWCHVAERTLFSDPAIAKLMNEWFVNIKVDREQRPDLDALFMSATQLLTGGAGGWPNNLFLTPALEPFYAGGYMPPTDDDSGRPGFPSVLQGLHDEWLGQPDKLAARAGAIVALLGRINERRNASLGAMAADARREQTQQALAARFDPQYGGFSGARASTKFPAAPALSFLLFDAQRGNARSREMLTVTLDALAYGGIFDQIGGGFHRYSTERSWSIPHFEKMLYDNAQLLQIYAGAAKLTGNPAYRRIAAQTADYLRTRLMAPDGGFYTAEDAEVDGREGASYLWSRHDVTKVLRSRARGFLGTYTVTPLPNPSPASTAMSALGVLRVGKSDIAVNENAEAAIGEQRKSLALLLAERNRRKQPLRDEKLIVALNGLAIDALCTSATLLHRPQDLVAAERAAQRLWRVAYDARSGTLHRQIFRGRGGGVAYPEDYAALGNGFLSLYEATRASIWLERATALAQALQHRFDPDDDGNFTATAYRDQPFAAPSEMGDETYPSAASSAVALALGLARATGEARYRERAMRMAAKTSGPPAQWPAMVAALGAAGVDQPLAGNAADDTDRPHASASARRIASTGADEVVITLEIEPGFHVNANPATLDFLVPTRVRFEGAQPGEIRYPAGKPFRSKFALETLSVYEGATQIVARFDAGVLSKLPFAAQIEVQACTETLCLPPTTLPVSLGTP